ncbi:SusD-like protein [Arenibacter antarcticus]|uniref:RagB/SusD family nutrient uptake outer membrane protein n=1 Tax=Arenibacter antarcticus TaxID=2040469 RepID=A0ABW5VIF0_9FLAO|nr:RagB/SusD family nutrient uptake outer membrane protein [Arenibacter sp. H213]MCM4167106.1 RagB/SusD family nutrient uptake outer membrane protein [Arenibacter sp. H213]
MKYKIKIAALILSFLFWSCDIEPEITDSYSDEVAWSSEENLELYLNTFYPLIGQSYYSPAVGLDANTDILKMNSPTDYQNLMAYGSIEITSASNPLGNWNWGYSWIRTCNEFLDGLKKNGDKLDPLIVKRAEGEVRWFRAHVYFELAKRYGGQAILFDDLPKEEHHPLSTSEVTWSFIEKDLDFAALNLPNKGEVPLGKLTKGAAYGLKARVMLYAERWKKASDAAKEVMDMGQYGLYPSYADLFKLRRSANINNPESIVEFGFTSPDFGYSFDYFYTPPGDQGYSQVSPTENLVSSYQMADGSSFDWDNPAHKDSPYANREERFYASILYNGSEWKGRNIETFVNGVDGFAVGGGTTSTGYYMRKLFDGSVKTQDVGFEPGELTYYYMRYAEILLIYGEAMAQQDNLVEALKALNEVRERAGFTQLVDASTKKGFMDLLHHERKIELAFEGHRYWDLRRWGLASDILGNLQWEGTKITKIDDSNFEYEVLNIDNGRNHNFPDRYNRFPIPTVELQRNPLIKQFPEWE